MPIADCEIGLLIGCNCARAMMPREVIPPDGEGPYGQRTDLGWSIVGVVSPECVFDDYCVNHCVSHRCWFIVGCFGFNGPLRQYFSLYRAVSQSEGERGERIDDSKNILTTPTRTYCKHSMPLPYCYQNCRTPRYWKFTQHHRTTRPPP